MSKSTLAFIGRSAAIGLSDSEIVQHGWNLDELAVDYEELMHRCAVDTRRNHEVKVSDYVRTVNMWKALSMRDPQLPKGILADWIGRRATECYREWYADVSPVIYARWRELVSEVDIHARIR